MCFFALVIIGTMLAIVGCLMASLYFWGHDDAAKSNIALGIAAALMILLVIFAGILDAHCNNPVQDPAESSVCEESEAPTSKPIKVIIGYPAHAGTLDETENDESGLFVAETYQREQEEQAPRFVMSADDGGFVYRETYFDKRTGRNERIRMPYEWQLYAYECAQRHNVSFDLVLAVMGMESGFDVFIGSRFDRYGNEYYGPGMVSVDCAEEHLGRLGITLCTVEGGIEAVAIILADKLDEFPDDVHKALIAYNCGSYGAQTLFDKGITETNYSKRVLQIMEGF